MKKLFAFTMVSILSLVVLGLGSCQRSSDDIYNDTQSAGRHMARGIKTLAGYHGESREISNPDDFYGRRANTQNSDFIAFEDDQIQTLEVAEDEMHPQPFETPGESGSSIPGIDGFTDPELVPELAEVFKHVHFEYNKSVIKGQENFAIIMGVADWLKNHPNVYIFVEGHCDSRGPSAYNFALGANRSNAVRNMLIKEGVSYDRIYTISYGKERPLVDGEGEAIWQLNRRGQFKVYEK